MKSCREFTGFTGFNQTCSLKIRLIACRQVHHHHHFKIIIKINHWSMVSESFISLHLHHYDDDQKRRPMESRSSPHPLEARTARRLAKEQRECLRQEQRGFSSSSSSSLFGIMMIITIISFESTMS